MHRVISLCLLAHGSKVRLSVSAELRHRYGEKNQTTKCGYSTTLQCVTLTGMCDSCPPKQQKEKEPFGIRPKSTIRSSYCHHFEYLTWSGTFRSPAGMPLHFIYVAAPWCGYLPAICCAGRGALPRLIKNKRLRHSLWGFPQRAY